MKARHLIYSLSVLCMLVFSACEREELENTQNGGTGTKMELVSVPSKFIVTPFGLQPGDTTSVKAVDYTGLEMQILDFWLIQFDDSGQLLASVYHAPELVSNYVQMDNTNGNIAATKTVWIVANTGDDSGLATDVLRAQLAASKVQMGSEYANKSDLDIFELDGYKFTTDSESSIASLNREDGAILMSGKCAFNAADLYDSYPDGTPNYEVARKGLEVTLSSMVAKLTINYKVEGSGYTLNTIKLFRIPDRASFAKNDITRTDYKLLSYEYLIPNAGSTVYDGSSITIYVPQNKRSGEHYTKGNQDAITKTFNAPPKASYISFGLTKSNGDKVSVNVFPGGSADGDENKYSDYNLCANAYYTEIVNITSSTLDSYLADELTKKENRVIEKLQQNITSNCYILNPLTDVNATGFNYSNLREEYYSLPVVARVNEAWYGQDNDKTLSANDEWRMEVIWQDVPGRQVYFSESSGLKAWKNQYGLMKNGGSDEANNPSYAHFYYGRGNGENGFVNIFVKKESQNVRTEGNVLIGLRKKTGVDSNGENTYGDIIWSWHLWVTDYNPDKMSGNSTYYRTTPGDTDDSGVRDGKVYHYRFWAQNSYKWIMDRHLGARGWRPAGMFGHPDGEASDPMPDGGHESYGLYYQWGRKDPFPGRDLVTNNEYMNNGSETSVDANINNLQKLYDITGETQLNTNGNESIINNISNGLSIANSHSQPTKIGVISDKAVVPWRHPTAKQWPLGNDDTKLVGTYTEKQVSKSLYDPCPAGWEVPNVDAYTGFVKSKGATGSANFNRSYIHRFYEIDASTSQVGTGEKNLQFQVNNGGFRIDAGGGDAYTDAVHYYGTISTTADVDNVYTYFPCSGFYTSDGRKDMQGIGDIWAADLYNSNNAAYLYIGRAVSGEWVSTGASLYINNTEFGFKYAFSVRCVKK